MSGGVKITEHFALRMASTIRRVEAMSETSGGGKIPVRFEDRNQQQPDPVRLGKTTSAWNKGTTATITLYESGTPPSETTESTPETLENCVNKFTNVASGKWVIVARGLNGYWYLISAECS
jgi:hypothetical protein